MDSLPAPFVFVVFLFAGWVNRQQQAVIDYLLEENRVLRARRQLDLPVALTHPFGYRRRGVASRSLLPMWQTQGGHDGTEGQR
jgi:hypothetical protein